MDDDSHDGGDREHGSREHERSSNKSLLLRPFSWKHKQEPADAALLGDLNRSMRSSHEPRLMMPSPAHGGEGKSTDGSKPRSLRVKIRSHSSSPMRVAVDPLQHRQERIDEAAAGEEKDQGNDDHASGTKPNDAALRAPPTPPATAGPEDERKGQFKARPPPQERTGIHAGDQEPGSSSTPPPRPSGKKRIRSTHHHQDQAPEPAGVGDEMEKALRLGEMAARTMGVETLKSEAYKFCGLEDLPKSQRLVTMQRKDADRPRFKFQLPEDKAKADVREVLLAPKRKRSPKK